MNCQTTNMIERTTYNRKDCQIGVVHLGYGAFHRAHQAVYIDDYMEKSGDLNWGIAAVNLRPEDRDYFHKHINDADRGYLLKTTTPEGETTFREVRSHIHFSDWSEDLVAAEMLAAQPNVKVISMTVTESGYYLNDDWTLNVEDPVIKNEIDGNIGRSVYSYLAGALKRRMDTIGEPITVLCCDNIRSNGAKLGRNFLRYLEVTGQNALAAWVIEHTTFPNSMVDRITPRATDILQAEIELISPEHAETAIHGESYSQWVLENRLAAEFPALDLAGVEIVEDVDPYEEAKIRILNGGHTALCYLGALAGYQTFDQAMHDPVLLSHFEAFERECVLPGLTLDLPFDKDFYLSLIEHRFSNSAIADDLARICMDGWSKFPIFVRPTISSCLKQGIVPQGAYDSIASWYVYARRFASGQTHIPYIEPYWDQLEPLLEQGKEAEFASLEALWSTLPKQYDGFTAGIVAAISRMEEAWPV